MNEASYTNIGKKAWRVKKKQGSKYYYNIKMQAAKIKHTIEKVLDEDTSFVEFVPNSVTWYYHRFNAYYSLRDQFDDCTCCYRRVWRPLSCCFSTKR